MRKVIIPLIVVLAVFVLSGAAICEEPQDISWLDGTVWENPAHGYKIRIKMENGTGTGTIHSLPTEENIGKLYDE